MTSLRFRAPRRRLLIGGTGALLAGLVAGPLVATLVMQHAWVRQALEQRLEASFGRPVEVGSFSMSLLGGLRVEANGVTVAEDARFGADFFLRAEQITASVHGPSLARGRLEFGRLSIYRPSLNLVRNSAGEWNFLAWLPAHGSRRVGTAPPGPPAPQPRLHRIEVEAGRVNFRQGADQHPFALVEVSGVMTPAGGGAWQLDLEAQPMRAGSITQEPGLLRVSGRVGGAESRVHPAELTLTWSEGSLSDALRLLRGRDFGVRGDPAVELTARATEPGQPWLLAGSARLAGMHRWDLPPRPSDPAVNLRFQAAWSPRAARVELTSATIEAAASNIRASGVLDWSRAGREDSHVRVASSGISLADLFAWYRAFRPGVHPGAAVDGNAALDAEWQGWPPRLTKLVMATDGARLRLPSLAEPVRMSRTAIRLARPGGRIELQPASFSFPGPAATRPPRAPDALRLEAAALPASGWTWQWRITGGTARAQEWLAAGEGLGLHPLNLWAVAGWQVQGAAELNLRGQGTLWPGNGPLASSLELRNGEVRAAFLPGPVRFAEARLEVDPLGRRARFAGAQAFGARWSGSLRSGGPGLPWEITASGEGLAPSLLDGWVSADEHGGPLAQRPSLLLSGFARGPLPVRGTVRVDARVDWPLLGPLRPQDVALDLVLGRPSGRNRPVHIIGSIAQPRLATGLAATGR